MPPKWAATPATRDWSLGADRTDFQTKAAGGFIETDAACQILVTAFSAPVPAGMTNEAWLAAYIAPDSSGARTTACTSIDKWEAITVDGKPGQFNPDACDASQAFVFIGDRVHVFSTWRPNRVGLLKAFLSTVRFRT